MKENNSILNINSAASRFCSVYGDLGSSLDSLGNEIYQLDETISEYKTRYNISGNINSFFSDNNITPEFIYGTLSDAEKYHDEAGNVIPYENLTDQEYAALESQAKAMNEEQANKKVEIVNLKAQIDKKTYEFERLIVQNKEKVRLAYENFVNEKKNLKFEKQAIELQIERAEYEIDKIKLDPSLSNRSMLIADYRKKISNCNAKLAVLNCVTRAADLYQVVFASAYESISVDMYESKDTIELQDQISDELGLVNSVQELISNLQKYKDNYNKEKEKVAEIEKGVSELKAKYGEKGNITDFVKKMNSTTRSMKQAIKELEANNDLVVGENSLGEEVVQENENPVNSPVAPAAGSEENNVPTPAEETPVVQEQGENPVTPNGGENQGEAQQEETPEQQTPAQGGEQPQTENEEAPTEENGVRSQNDPRNLDADNRMIKINRTRMARNGVKNFIGTVSAVTAVAGFSLGLAPVAVPATAVFGVKLAVDAGSLAFTGLYKGSVTHTLKKIAKKVSKDTGKAIRLGKPDHNHGTISFEYVDENGVTPIDSNFELTEIVDALNAELADSFKNNLREVDQPKTPKAAFYANLPKVSVDNLQAAYAKIGGVKLGRESIFANANSWITNSKLIGKFRDHQLGSRNNQATPVIEADIDDLHNADEQAPQQEQEVQQEAQQQAPEVETPASPEAPQEAEPAQAPVAPAPAPEAEPQVAPQAPQDAPATDDRVITDEELQNLSGELDIAQNQGQELPNAFDTDFLMNFDGEQGPQRHM